MCEQGEETLAAWTTLLDKPGAVPVVIKACDDTVIKLPQMCNGKVVDGSETPPKVTTRKQSFMGSLHRAMTIKGDYNTRGSLFRYRQQRTLRQVRKRVVFKHGDCNVVQGKVAKRRRRYLQDIFTTMVDAQWRWTLLIFALSFLLSWLGFAVIWWLISFTHGDLNRNEAGDPLGGMDITDSNVSRVVQVEEEWEPCITNIKSFTSCFLFSVETQHTIGYGGRTTTEQCPEAIFVMCLQSIVGVFIQAFMVGIVFAKLSRAKKRAQTLLFSRNAVICHRDGQPCLMFRVGDMRKSHIIEAHVHAQIIRKKVTREGELLPFYQQELVIGSDGGEGRLMFIWPTTVVHKINRRSPLYALSASDILREKFEIVVMLEGVVESTGMTTQARSSYLPTEILWGHRFESVVTFKRETGEYEVDFTLFNNTYAVDTPLCSSKQLDEVREALHTPHGIEHLNSSGLFPRVSSLASLTPPSDDSLSLDDHESLGLELRVPLTRSSGPGFHGHVQHPSGGSLLTHDNSTGERLHRPSVRPSILRRGPSADRITVRSVPNTPHSIC